MNFEIKVILDQKRINEIYRHALAELEKIETLPEPEFTDQANKLLENTKKDMMDCIHYET